jgi:hypothetical protein
MSAGPAGRFHSSISQNRPGARRDVHIFLGENGQGDQTITLRAHPSDRLPHFSSNPGFPGENA